jgi:hypothetical protein
LPTFDLRVPDLYRQVVQDADDVALLELPLGWRNGARVAGKQDVLIMQQLWYQTVHGKRVLGGNTSRNPEYKFQYFSEQPTLARLIALTNAADVPQHDALRAALAADPVTDEDRAAAQRWAAFTGIRYVMVHRDKLPAATEETVRALLPLTLVGEDSERALFRVDLVQQPEAGSRTTYRPSDDPDRMILGEGWSPVAPGSTGRDADGNDLGVYAQRDEVRLLLPLGRGAATVRLRMGALVPDQEVAVWVDGQDIAMLALSMQPGWIGIDVPPDTKRPPVSDVRLRFSRIIAVDELALRLSRSGPAGLLVRSAGQEAGDFGHIYINGREVSPNRRGYSLVALDASGALRSAASFDTHAEPEASAALAAWLAELPAGTVVAGAVRDEASLSLGLDAVDALRTLGVQTDLRERFRWGHAFVAQVGEPAQSWWAAPQEAVDAIRPAQVAFGLPLSEPALAAQLFEVEVNSK